jgi:hypothetical protein
MKRKRKIKYISPPMKFNPGTVGFEPDLPLRTAEKTGKKEKYSWFWIILIIIIIILFLILLSYY